MDFDYFAARVNYNGLMPSALCYILLTICKTLESLYYMNENYKEKEDMVNTTYNAVKKDKEGKSGQSLGNNSHPNKS